MSVVSLPQKKLNISDLIESMGITPGAHPNYFKDCFEVPENLSDQFDRLSSSLSRSISRIIPDKIDGAYVSGDELVREIAARPELALAAAMKAMPEIILAGLRPAVALLIIRKHPDIERYPQLVEVRDKIASLQKTRQAVIRGSKKGDHGQEIVKEVDNSLSSHNVAVLPLWKIYQVQKGLIELAFSDGNEKALQILQVLGLPEKTDRLQLP